MRCFRIINFEEHQVNQFVVNMLYAARNIILVYLYARALDCAYRNL